VRLEPRLTEQLIGKLGYLGIALILVLGGLGLPIPEEAPIILAAVLARNGRLWWPPALASCLAGVLVGDFVVYCLGYFYGEKVLSLRLTRRLLTRQREAQIQGYFHRHGFKILVSGRFVPGFRTAAYLTAGILKLPVIRLLVTDLIAASISTLVMFGLGFAFAYQIQKGIREVQQWAIILVALGISSWLLVRYYKARRSAGRLVGPPVLEGDEFSLPTSESIPANPKGADVAAAGPPARGQGLRPLAEGSLAPAPAEKNSAPGTESGASPELRFAPVSDRPRIPTPAEPRPAGPVGIDMDATTPQHPAETPSR
jgi:membrane protein DedA with SNARE-associated domain